MSWKRGDLGRFIAEHGKRPRFEVLGPTPDKQSIAIWYGGAAKPTSVPLATFKADCTNLWEIQERVPVLPPWLVEGGTFEFLPNTTGHVRQAEILRDAPPAKPFAPAWPPQGRQLDAVHTVNLEGAPLRIRSIRRDYTSCEIRGMLVMVPLPTIAKHGIKRKDRWTRLLDNDLFGEEDLEEDLFRDLR